MEVGKTTIEVKNNKPIHLYFLGDIHEGNCNCDHKALKKAVDIIKNDPVGYWFGMGDYIEAITHFGDPRFDPKSISEEYAIKDLKDLPFKQAERVFNYLKPIQDKCLALLVGNHEESYIKRHSANVYDRFTEMFETSAHESGKPPKKLGYVGFYEIALKYNNYHITVGLALSHGVGGGGYLEGYPISKVWQAFKYTYADINVMGHVHRLKEDSINVVTVKRGRVFKKRKLVGVSGTFLQTYVEGNPNYFEAFAGRSGESDIGMLRCDLSLVRDRANENINWDAQMHKVMF